MIRGFIVGSLALIAIYVVVQQGNVDRVASAGGVSLSLLQKLLDPGVPAIPDRAATPIGVGKGKRDIMPAAAGAPEIAGMFLGSFGGSGLAGGAGAVS